MIYTKQTYGNEAKGWGLGTVPYKNESMGVLSGRRQEVQTRGEIKNKNKK